MVDIVHPGVYIGTDIELVIFDKYMISYRRNRQKGFLESRLFRWDEDKHVCIGICISSPTETEKHKIPMLWRTASIFHDEVVGTRKVYRKEHKVDLSKAPIYDDYEDPDIKKFIGTQISLSQEGDFVTIDFGDGIKYVAALDESLIQGLASYPLPTANENNIGTCLQMWQLGIHEEYFKLDGVSVFGGIRINTLRHMYIFELLPNSIYCRAARFIATNKGVVFNQNFRQGFEAYMIEDNNDARLPLEYDETIFSSDACVWNSRSVYWSLAAFTDNEIALHGCQGDTYYWRRTNKK